MGVTPQQFEQMKKRLGGARPSAGPVLESSYRPVANTHQIILGVDPSLRGTGFGVIRFGKPGPQALTHGVISCPAGWERSRCLVKISQTLRELISKFQPTTCAIEGLFFAQNLQTALIMGRSTRGGTGRQLPKGGFGKFFENCPPRQK